MHYVEILKKTGTKFGHVATMMGMKESLLRYHLSRERVDDGVRRKFLSAVSQIATQLRREVARERGDRSDI